MGRSPVQKARELYRLRKFSEVVALCRVHQSGPEHLELRLLLARALLALGRDAEARIEASECLRMQSRCADAYQILGQVAMRNGEHGAAEIFLCEAVRLGPSDARSRFLLGLLDGSPDKADALARLRRERPRLIPSGTVEPGMDREITNPSAGAFGEFLVGAGVISRAQLFDALRMHYTSGVRLGQAIVKLGYADRHVVESRAQRYHSARGRKPARRPPPPPRFAGWDDLTPTFHRPPRRR